MSTEPPGAPESQDRAEEDMAAEDLRFPRGLRGSGPASAAQRRWGPQRSSRYQGERGPRAPRATTRGLISPHGAPRRGSCWGPRFTDEDTAPRARGRWVPAAQRGRPGRLAASARCQARGLWPVRLRGLRRWLNFPSDSLGLARGATDADGQGRFGSRNSTRGQLSPARTSV